MAYCCLDQVVCDVARKLLSIFLCFLNFRNEALSLGGDHNVPDRVHRIRRQSCYVAPVCNHKQQHAEIYNTFVNYKIKTSILSILSNTIKIGDLRLEACP